MRKGQALVMVLLILGIALTVGLSIISRSVTEISVSTTSDESSRALEAAEEGVQKSLAGVIAGNVGITVGSTNSTVQVKNEGVAGDVNAPYDVPFKLSAGEAVSVDLVGPPAYPSGNWIGICWGDNSIQPAQPAPGIEVALYYRAGGGEIRVGREGFYQGGSGGFTAPNGNVNCNPPFSSEFQSSHRLNLSSLMNGSGTPLLLRVKMLYTSVPQRVKFWPQSGSSLPKQGKDVISTGQSGSATQKLHVIQTNADLPAMFDSALFSGQGLVK